MSELTDRADAALNQANAGYLQGQIKREKDTTTKPTIFHGMQGDRALVQRLGEGTTASGVPVTNGAIGQAGFVEMRGQFVDAMPRVKRNPAPSPPKTANTPGVVFWTDTEWLYALLYTNVMIQTIKLFKTKIIYKLASNAPGYVRARGVLETPAVVSALNAANIEIRNVNSIEEASKKKGLFYLELMREFYVFSETDFTSLRKIAKRNGLIIAGERTPWMPYNNRILRGLKIRDEVTIEQPEDDVSIIAQTFKTVSKINPSINFEGSGNGKFIGLNNSERFVKNGLDDDVFAFFKP